MGSVHTAGVARLALRIGRVLPLLWSSRYGGAPSERQHHLEHGKRAGPSHAITQSAIVSACFSARPSYPTLWSDPGCHQDSAGGTISQPSFPERQAVEFGVEIGEYHGVPRRAFQRLLPERPTPEKCVAAYYLQRTRFERLAERKLRRRQLTEDGNVEITGRDLR